MTMKKKKPSAPRFKKAKRGFGNVFVYDLGCKFRSKFEWYTAKRLEKARIKWEHEPRITLQDSYVLPDFWLPEYQMFIELRPRKCLDEKLLQKVRLLKKIYEHEVIVITDLKGAETFIARLLLLTKSPQECTSMNEVIIFEGKRGEKKSNLAPKGN